MQWEPTRGENVLDLYCTNKPVLVKTVTSIPGISDHDIIVVNSDIHQKYKKKASHKVHRFKKAQWQTIREEMTTFAEEYAETSENFTVDENCLHIK